MIVTGKTIAVPCHVAYSTASPWTFEIPPIRDFVDRWLAGCAVIVDPFAGRSTIGTLRNDIANGECSITWLDRLVEAGTDADAVLFDPPYSPRQVAEHYRAAGRKVSQSDTQVAHLHSEIRRRLRLLLKPGGIALSFGWNSSGLGNRLKTVEILLCRHGGSHYDTICVAQKKPSYRKLFNS